MTKRKLDISIDLDSEKEIQNISKIIVIENHLYFNLLINNENLKLLKMRINDIIEDYNFNNDKKVIYLHINSCGGYVKDLIKNIDIFDLSVKIISVIENSISDCAILLSGLCETRLCKKHSKFTMRVILRNYWYLLKQCEDIEIKEYREHLKLLFIKISKQRLSGENIEKMFQYGGEWNSTKLKRLGLVDEII